MKAPQDIILKPMITEQSVDNMQQSKYTFKVAKDANKIEIAQAAEALFHVEVVKVNTVNCTGKTKRVGRFTGKKADKKGNHHHQSGNHKDRQGWQEAEDIHRIL